MERHRKNILHTTYLQDTQCPHAAQSMIEQGLESLVDTWES
jgi:hypothetical protein